jgi:CBS domain containing-hemolysin-like protein
LTLLLLYVSLALGFSFLCSVLEAVLLSVSVFELAPRADQGDAGAKRMIKLKETQLDEGITSILVLNTIAHTVGATMAGAQASKVFGSESMGIFSALLTLAILVGTEVVPKTLGANFAGRLAGPAARTIAVLATLLKPVLFFTGFLTRLLANKEEAPLSRAELAAFLAAARKEGALKRDQWRIFDNMLRFEEIRVQDVMTPRTVVAMVSVESTIDDLLNDSALEPYTRIPVFEGARDHVVGYVLRRDVLEVLAAQGDRAMPVRSLMREVAHVSESTSLAEALRGFLDRREPLAMALDEFGGVSGVITLEDVLETILGQEILDEVDQVPDLRATALKLRDRRLDRMRSQQKLVAEPPPHAEPFSAEASPDPAEAEPAHEAE